MPDPKLAARVQAGHITVPGLWQTSGPGEVSHKVHRSVRPRFGNALSDHDLALGLRLLRNVTHVRVDGLGHPLHAIQPARKAELFEAFLTGDQAANCSLADVVRAQRWI